MKIGKLKQELEALIHDLKIDDIEIYVETYGEPVKITSSVLQCHDNKIVLMLLRNKDGI